MYCKHLVNDGLAVGCPAFPSAIPPEIRGNRFDHRGPYPDQEGSTVLEFDGSVSEPIRVTLGVVLSANHRPAEPANPFADPTQAGLAAYLGAKIEAIRGPYDEPG